MLKHSQSKNRPKRRWRKRGQTQWTSKLGSQNQSRCKSKGRGSSEISRRKSSCRCSSLSKSGCRASRNQLRLNYYTNCVP
jgi:hypothetical protein